MPLTLREVMDEIANALLIIASAGGTAFILGSLPKCVWYLTHEFSQPKDGIVEEDEEVEH